MAAAAAPLPIEAKRALRPSRSPKPAMAGETEADRSDSRTKHAACGRMQHARPPNTMANTGHKASASALSPMATTPTPRHEPRGAHGIDQRARGQLTGQRRDAAGAENESDIALRPRLRCEIDRDERTESGLDVGEKEDEPVEPARTPARGFRPHLARCRRHEGLRPVAIGVIKERWCCREQRVTPASSGGRWCRPNNRRRMKAPGSPHFPCETRNPNAAAFAGAETVSDRGCQEATNKAILRTSAI